jgi:AraC-like DNA-binding protein
MRVTLRGVARFRTVAGRLELPDVCCDVVYVGGRRLLCGPLSRARESPYIGEDVVLLKIGLTSARSLIGLPLSELTDKTFPLELVNARLAHELDASYERGRLLELVTSAPCASADARFAAASALLARRVPVARAADAVALSERQLERLLDEHAGLSPKTFARIVRFRRAVVAARGGMPLASAAAASGYADQSHFTRDVRDLTGHAPRALLPNVGSVQDIVAGEI